MPYRNGRYKNADRIHILEDHFHGISKVYPTLADGVTLTCVNEATTWTLSALVEIIPADTITSWFDIHFISIENISANGVYELVLYSGAGDDEIARVRFTKTAAQDSTRNTTVMTPMVAPNSRIRAAIASDDDAGQTVDISFNYHTY